MIAGVPGAGTVATNPALQQLDPAVRNAYADLLLFLGDSDLVVGHRHSEWTGFAPSAEADVAFSSIAQDELGHAHLYYALLVGADDEDVVDAVALDRGPRQLRHLPLLHAHNGDWFFTIARHVYWELFEQTLLGAAVRSDLPLLAGAAQRVLNEEQYHEEHAVEWLELLSSRGGQRRRLAKQLERVTELGGNPILSVKGLPDLASAGYILGPGELAEAFRNTLGRRLRGAGWSEAESAPSISNLGGAGTGTVPPGLYQLHADLTGLRRAHPGASW